MFFSPKSLRIVIADALLRSTAPSFRPTRLCSPYLLPMFGKIPMEKRGTRLKIWRSNGGAGSPPVPPFHLQMFSRVFPSEFSPNFEIANKPDSGRVTENRPTDKLKTFKQFPGASP